MQIFVKLKFLNACVCGLNLYLSSYLIGQSYGQFATIPVVVIGTGRGM